MKLIDYSSIQFLIDEFDMESIDECVFKLSFILGLSDSFGKEDKDELLIFLSDLRHFRQMIEADIKSEKSL